MKKGKSLSIICSSLSWLKSNNLIDSEAKQETILRTQEPTPQSKSENPIDWAEEHYLKRKEQEKQAKSEERAAKLEKERKRLNEVRKLMEKEEERPSKRPKLEAKVDSILNPASHWEDNFELADYDSEEGESNVDPTSEILKKILDEDEDDKEKEEEMNVRKVISQFQIF